MSIEMSSVLSEMSPVDRMRREELRVSGRAALRNGSRRIARRTAVGIVSLIALYFALCLPVAWYQTRLIYWNDVADMADAVHDGWSVRSYVSHDPAHGFAAYVHAGRPGLPTVVYLHGRGEDFEIIRDNVDAYVRQDWTVVAPEYPGFAGLAGEPEEHVINALMGKVYADLTDRGTKSSSIIIHGNSLGAGPALQIAQFPHGFLFLSAPVGSMRKLIHHYVPFYPTMLLRDQWDNARRARTRWPAPAQVIHAADDVVVPVEQGRMLAGAARAAYREYPGGGHLIARYDSNIRIMPDGQIGYSDM